MYVCLSCECKGMKCCGRNYCKVGRTSTLFSVKSMFIAEILIIMYRNI